MEDDDGDVSHSINHDLRLMGETGDDKDGHGDLGSSAAAPTDLAVGDPSDGNGEGGPEAAAAAAHGSRDRKRSNTSKVWADFEPMYTIKDGRRVRYGGKYHWCKVTLSVMSSSGTRHLLRHQRDCKVKKAKMGKQSMIRFNPGGSVCNFDYCPHRARTEMCRLIARLDLPLNFGESPAFEEYIKLSHNPSFKSVTRQTTSRDLVKYYTDRRKVIVDCLLSASSIAITSDIWFDNAKEDYLSVVAHYINKGWLLEKRIIGLRLIESAHTGENIADHIFAVIDDFGCTNKVISITLDNASSNSKAMEKLRHLLSGYVGTLFLHQCCACHIVNLIVKSGLKRLKPYIEAFRTAISFLNSSNQRIAAYKSYFVVMNVRPRKFGLDMDVRWNSTYCNA
jgi:hypothetical protein